MFYIVYAEGTDKEEIWDVYQIHDNGDNYLEVNSEKGGRMLVYKDDLYCVCGCGIRLVQEKSYPERRIKLTLDNQ